MSQRATSWGIFRKRRPVIPHHFSLYIQVQALTIRIWIQCLATYRFALAGIENPLVMKSRCFSSIPFFDENRLLTFSLAPSFLLLFLSSCSASTFAVRDAVSAFLILLSGFVTMLGPESVARVTFLSTAGSSTLVFFFLFLLLPDAFFKEWVSPCSFRLWIRCSSLSLSACDVGRICMVLSAS